MKNDGKMILGKQENHKNPTLPTTVVTMVTPRFETTALVGE